MPQKSRQNISSCQFSNSISYTVIGSTEQFPLYENILCTLMAVISENMEKISSKSALLHNIYVKYLLDCSLDLFLQASHDYKPDVDEIQCMVAKVYNIKTNIKIFELEDCGLKPHEVQFLASTINFGEFCSQLSKSYDALKIKISAQHEEIFYAVLSYGLTKIDFFKVCPQKIIEGCLIWLCKKFEINIPKIQETHEEDKQKCSIIFSRLIQELQE